MKRHTDQSATSGLRAKGLLFILANCASIAFFAVCAWRCQPANPALAEIHGRVAAVLRQGAQVTSGGIGRVEIPDARVTATEVNTGTVSTVAISNAHGYFKIPPLAAGTYQVCANAAGSRRSTLSFSTTGKPRSVRAAASA